MTSKEKARELIYSYLPIVKQGYSNVKDEACAKHCSIICAQEKVNEFTAMNTNIMGLQFNDKIFFWRQVITELENETYQEKPKLKCECELKFDNCTMMCEHMLHKMEGR